MLDQLKAMTIVSADSGEVAKVSQYQHHSPDTTPRTRTARAQRGRVPLAP